MLKLTLRTFRQKRRFKSSAYSIAMNSRSTTETMTTSPAEITRPWEEQNPLTLNEKAILRFSSYNILAPHYAQNCKNKLYSHLKLKENLLDWPARFSKIKSEIIDLKSDVICLQEVEFEYYHSDILAFLESEGYEARFYQKYLLRDGSLIAFKKSKFVVVAEQYVNMYNEQKCKSGQIGIVLVLKHQDTQERIIIGTTHLAYNPYRGDWKVIQLIHLLAAMKNQRQRLEKNNFKNHSSIICGDFNSEPESTLVQFVLDGEANLDNVRAQDLSLQAREENNWYQYKHGHIGENSVPKDFLRGTNITRNCLVGEDSYVNIKKNVISHDLNLKSAYKLNDSNRGWTAVSSLDRAYYDYMFYNGSLSPHKVQSFPKNSNPMPNETYGSDHYSISVDFALL